MCTGVREMILTHSLSRRHKYDQRVSKEGTKYNGRGRISIPKS